ncbi:MAG: NAD(P)-binding domain-containing protein [Pseudomonadota bacterium]
MTTQTWLDDFSAAVGAGSADRIGKLFAQDCYWRDYLPFGWTLQTLEGREDIAAFGASKGPASGFRDPALEDTHDAAEGFFTFTTKDGPGRGYVRRSGDLCTTLFTQLEGLGAPNPKTSGQTQPFVLVVGGGQGGLALGAQLADLGVPYLIIDKYPRVGDQWRSRYDSLVLHDPVWYDHMPFKPFPSDWPVFTPKDRIGDWLESYAQDLGLDIWTSTELTSAEFDTGSARWTAHVMRDGAPVTATPTHIVMALGLSGFPNVPTVPGQETFAGPQMHSSAFKLGQEFAGQDVVVVGANNSAHDIAADLVSIGARPTLLQRSSSLVVRQDDYCKKVLGPLYSAEAVAKGITTENADLLQASVPLRLLEKRHRAIWDGIRVDQRGYYQRLSDAGFTLDFAEDGTGLGMKYRRTASGYYIDVGAAEMVMDGRIAVRSGHGISHLSENAVHLEDGTELKADAVVYATGYGDMTDWIAKFMNREIADRIGRVWGYGSNTKGDPGPWIGELRNMWVETAQTGLWFTGGNLSQARYYSRFLALQLAQRHRA